jgi:hypothetical protein
MAILPIAKAVYVCDVIALDPQTGKVNLLGIWEQIQVPANTHFPFRIDRFSVFIWWKGGHGSTRTCLELIDARTGALIRRTDEVVIDFVSRTDSAYGGYEFAACEFPESGYY